MAATGAHPWRLKAEIHSAPWGRILAGGLGVGAAPRHATNTKTPRLWRGVLRNGIRTVSGNFVYLKYPCFG